MLAVMCVILFHVGTEMSATMERTRQTLENQTIMAAAYKVAIDGLNESHAEAVAVVRDYERIAETWNRIQIANAKSEAYIARKFN
jgi:hypothetical protein